MFKYVSIYHFRMKWRFVIEAYLEENVPSKKHTTHFHIAFLFLRGKLLAAATNQIGSRSRGSGYSNYTMHAERAVVKEIGDFSKIKDCTLVVIRLGKNGELLNSKPCKECQPFLQKCKDVYGLGAVYHS